MRRVGVFILPGLKSSWLSSDKVQHVAKGCISGAREDRNCRPWKRSSPRASPSERFNSGALLQCCPIAGREGVRGSQTGFLADAEAGLPMDGLRVGTAIADGLG